MLFQISIKYLFGFLGICMRIYKYVRVINIGFCWCYLFLSYLIWLLMNICYPKCSILFDLLFTRKTKILSSISITFWLCWRHFSHIKLHNFSSVVRLSIVNLMWAWSFYKLQVKCRQNYLNKILLIVQNNTGCLISIESRKYTNLV